ncbi:MAG TPA: hypothetical protein PKZ84_11635 [Anaerolineae bacterium]|nr:hypothetical protein [Anaerolineae bacterium]
MMNISPSLYEQVRSTLLRCGPFDSSANLGALFVDARISPWRYALPDAAPSRLVRVETVINALSEQFTASGENALVLLLHLLRDRTSPGDACYGQLGALADALAQELTSPAATPQAPYPASAANTVPASGSFRERKRQLLQQRLAAQIEEYEAANRQLAQTLGEVECVRIKRQMETLEKQIQETEAELAAMG